MDAESSELKLQCWSKGPLVTESRRGHPPALGARDRNVATHSGIPIARKTFQLPSGSFL